jgi:hypothetical protein
MFEDHPLAGILHNLSDCASLGGIVAMHFTFAAPGFVFERAFVQFLFSIFEQIAAVVAESASRVVFIAAKYFYHLTDSYFFTSILVHQFFISFNIRLSGRGGI